jgi:DNA polymerase
VAATTARKADIRAEVHDATDGLVSGPSKRNDLLTFILAEHGVTLPDLKADTLRRRLDDPDLPDGVKLLLSLRLESNKASTAKYAALLKSASPDGRLRNTQQFCGAARTGRVAHRLFQPGNMPRPDMQAEDIDIGIEAMKAGCADLTHDVMRLGVNAVRGCIVAPPGRKLVVADLANIEGRGLVYLAGENWKLRAFAEYDAGTGPDLYCVAFGRSFGVEPTTVKGADRQIGKVQELALGYEGGVGAFLTFAAVYGMDLDKLADAVHRTAPRGVLAAAYRMHEWTEGKKISTYGLSQSVWVACEALKAMWRTAHPRTVSLWRAAHVQTALAILNPGVTFDIGEHVKARRDGNWLRLRLPSGRYLCYLAPKVTEDGSITYMGVNQYTRQWGRIKTYGGKLVENLTQAFARDVMFYNMPRIEAAGYNIVLTVHDEVLTETPDSSEYNSDALGALLATVPSWAEGIPLSAAGFETSRYRKD